MGLGEDDPTELGRAKEGCMFDPQYTLASLALAITVLMSVTLVLSRIIPDEYDRRAPVRRRVDQGASRRS
jgi:hypothetical protein